MALFRLGSSRIITDGFWVSFGFAINALASLIISIFLVRLLDVEQVGVFFLVFSIVTIVSTIAQFGLNVSVVRFVGRNVRGGGDNCSRATLLKMLLTVCFIAGIATIFFMSDQALEVFGQFKSGAGMLNSLSIIGLWIFFTALRSYLAEVFRGFHDIKLAALYQRILPNIILVFVIGSLVLLPLSISLHNIIVVFFIVNAVLVILALLPFINRLKTLPKKENIPFKTVLFSGAPIMSSQMLQFFVTQTPLWVLGIMSAAEYVADYGVAFRLAAVVSLPLLIVNNLIMPKIAKLHSLKDENKIQRLISYSVVISTITSLILMIMYVVVGEWMLEFLFGKQYLSAYILLLILAAGHVINVFSGSPMVILAMTGNERYVFICSAFSAVITVVVSMFVIPYWGVIGAVIATSFGIVLLNILLVYYCWKIVHYKTYLTISAFKIVYLGLRK